MLKNIYIENNNIKSTRQQLFTYSFYPHGKLDELIIKYLPEIICFTLNEKLETHSGFYKQNYCGCCFSLTEKMIGSINNLK